MRGEVTATPNDKLSAEKALIVDPKKEEASKYLTFNKEVIVAINNNPKGTETIKRTGLNRKEILKAMFEYLETLQVLAEIARKNLPETANAKAHFKKIGRTDKLYSLLVRVNFPGMA